MVPNKYVLGAARALIVALGLTFVVFAGRGAYSAVDVGLVLLTQERYKADPDPTFTELSKAYSATVKPGAKVYTPMPVDDPWRQSLVEISVLHHTYLVGDAADADWIVWVVVADNAATTGDVRLEIRPAS